MSEIQEKSPLHKIGECLLTDYDNHLLSEGTHWEAYNCMGAQVCTLNDVTGVNFAVWAPNAECVSVIGDFNEWNKTSHVMKRHENGIWEIFIPSAKEGQLYKYLIRRNGCEFEKCDPYAFSAECPPKTASRITNLNRYHWNDQPWITQRTKKYHPDDTLYTASAEVNSNLEQKTENAGVTCPQRWEEAPVSIYEVHLGSWQRDCDDPDIWLNYRDIAQRLIPYVKKMGYTHIELLPVAEHPLTISWGYQITGYYAPTARYGLPEDFMYFVDLCHQNNIGVILDWVPAHFPKDEKGLGRFDGTALYEHADPRQGEHSDWGTYIFNYGRNEVRNFLIANALFWIDKYHIDGLRVDAVASMLYLDYSRNGDNWLPNKYGGRENIEAIDFLREMNRQVLSRFPGTVTIAEESTAWPSVTLPGYVGGLGFSMKWNMGWMHDSLAYMAREPVYRKFHHDQLTFSIMYSFQENYVLPLSHDEVVHCKSSILGRMPGDLWQKFANLRLLYSYMWTHPGKKLIFMGNDIGQWTEWNVNGQVQWDMLQHSFHQGLQKCVMALNEIYRNESALYERDFTEQGFKWVDCKNRDISTLIYLRQGINPHDHLVVISNFTPVVRHDFWVGTPEVGRYKEIFNSDAAEYGGSNVINGSLTSTAQECHYLPGTLRITLPPLGLVIFKPEKMNDE